MTVHPASVRNGPIRTLAAAAALAGLLLGCSSGSDRSTGDQAAFCDAFVGLQGEDLGGPVASDAVLGHAEALAAAAPPEHAAAARQLLDDARVHAELMATGEASGELITFPEDTDPEAFEAVSRLEATAASDLAFHAHDVCEGVDDPSFELPCQPVQGGVSGRPDELGPGQEPIDVARSRLDQVEGAVDVLAREHEGVVEVAYVDGDGRAVLISTHHRVGDGWGTPSISTCEVMGPFGSGADAN